MRALSHELLISLKNKLVLNNGRIAVYIRRGQIDGNAILTCYIIDDNNMLTKPDIIVRRSGEADKAFIDQLVYWSFRADRIEDWTQRLTDHEHNDFLRLQADIVTACVKAVDVLFSETPWLEIQAECLAISLEAISK